MLFHVSRLGVRKHQEKRTRVSSCSLPPSNVSKLSITRVSCFAEILLVRARLAEFCGIFFGQSGVEFAVKMFGEILLIHFLQEMQLQRSEICRDTFFDFGEKLQGSL